MRVLDTGVQWLTREVGVGELLEGRYLWALRVLLGVDWLPEIRRDPGRTVLLLQLHGSDHFLLLG